MASALALIVIARHVMFRFTAGAGIHPADLVTGCRDVDLMRIGQVYLLHYEYRKHKHRFCPSPAVVRRQWITFSQPDRLKVTLNSMPVTE